MERLDLRGKPCPIPVIEAKKRLAAMPPGARLTVLVDNDVARQNLQKMAAGQGHDFVYEAAPEGGVLATFTVRGTPGGANAESGTGLVVAIGGERMGRGDDDLGGVLMKSFLFSLSEQDVPPEHVLLFNGGVRLACAGSQALDDLSTLVDRGAIVSACGACLNHYRLVDALKVGAVTNMAAILEVMARAKRLINL